ncbi:MAG: sulfatase-like hydrolase/transferase [Bryobacteraceae bacterium]
MNRRTFSQTLAGGVAARRAFGHSAPSGNARPKNVLLLMADQHRPTALGINGDRVARTPNLDSLANTGARFDHAYCSSPVCVPSRASLLTGLWAHNHGAYSNGHAWPFQHKTIAHHFARAGYMTALIGKMHFVDAQTHGFDYHLDFNDWLQYLGPKASMFAEEIGLRANSGSGLPQIPDLWRESGDPWPGAIPSDGRLGLVALGRISKLEERDHFESFVTRESIRFLKEQAREQPFLLIGSYLKPHDPFMPAARFYNMFRAGDMKIPDTWHKVNLATVPAEIRESIQNERFEPELLHDPENVKRQIALYYANLAQMDDNIGQMLGAIRDLKLENDTVVVYTSDHGEMLGEHGLWQKMVFYEPAAGVPLIFRVPGITEPGSRTPTLVSLVSVLPTLLELCGIPAPSGLDGESLAGDLHNSHRTRDTTVYSEYALASKGAKAMIRHGDYKYINYSHDAPDEMFNLRDDPREMNNLAIQPAFSARADELKSKLFAWHRPA